jgi:amino acid transporter
VDAGLFGLALISVLWAYDGFADLSFAGGEIRNPQRNLPRALVGGTLAIIAIYVLTNAAYLYVSPIDTVASSPLIAADTMLALVGPVGVTAVSSVVMISTFGSVNGSLLANPRIFFAMADDGLFFRSIASVHPRFHTPHVAIGVAAALGVWFVLTRTFEQLTDTFVLTMWPFYALSAAAVYRLRRSRPDLVRPYRVAGYPIVPAVFIAGVLYLVGNALVENPFWTLIVFAIVAAGLPVYWMFFRSVRIERS